MNDNQDRRRFFRINDTIGVSYQLIASNGEPEPSSATLQNGRELIQHYSKMVQQGLGKLEESNHELAELLGLMNRKFDTALKLLELEEYQNRTVLTQIEEASISACGLGFPVDELIQKDQLIALILRLRSSSTDILATGRVVDCQPVDTNHYYLRVEFTEIANQDRERLIQHIVQRQGVLLRELREQIEE